VAPESGVGAGGDPDRKLRFRTNQGGPIRRHDLERFI
jgi:hypothetical protein